MEKQEYLMRMQVIEEEARQIEMQIGMIDQQSNELIQISKSLEQLWIKEENPEFLANLGKGIFVKAKALEKEIFVSIGNGTVVKKTPEEAVEIIMTQLRRASETKSEFMSRINELQIEMQKLAEEAGKDDKSHNEEECSCGEECKCEEECGDDCKCKEHKHK